MKQIGISFVMMLIIGLTGYSSDDPIKKVTNVAPEKEDAIHCRVESAGGAIVSCWFCDCGELYDSVQNA